MKRYDRFDESRLTDYFLVLAAALILFIPLIAYFLETR